MTEFNDRQNIDPYGADDEADARWFRTAVAPVVDARPVPDAWDEIRARATGEAPTVVRLAPAPGPGRLGTRRRLALAAAAVLVVAGIGGAAVLSRDAGSGDDETIVAAPPDEEATGWYVPEDLPEGWELESVETDWLDAEDHVGECPCSSTAWRSPGRPGIASFRSGLPAADPTDDVPESSTVVDLGQGVRAVASTQFLPFSLRWVEGTSAVALYLYDTDEELLLTAGRHLVASGDPHAPPLEGYEEAGQSSNDGSVTAYHAVMVQLHHPETGRTMAYELIPPGTDAGLFVHLLESEPVDGAVHPLARIVDDQWLVDGHPGILSGHWPGADVSSSSGQETSKEELLVLFTSLRPATSAQWDAFLDTATGSVDDDARTDRLADLIVYEGDQVPAGEEGPTETTEPDIDEQVEVQTTTPDVAMTSAMDLADRFTTFASQVGDGSTTVPDDLFASSVDIGIGTQVIRQVNVRNLVGPDAWMVDEDDGMELYAGWSPPFSALDRLEDAEAASVELVAAPGGADGCVGTPPDEPDLDEGQILVSIAPMGIDSCIDWFAVTLVIDSASERIAGVHLYLREP